MVYLKSWAYAGFDGGEYGAIDSGTVGRDALDSLADVDGIAQRRGAGWFWVGGWIVHGKYGRIYTWHKIKKQNVCICLFSLP